MVGKSRQWQLVACSALAVALLAMTLAGCSKPAPTGTVEGTVTLNGEPYTDAAVVFLDLTTGQGGTANIEGGGTFKIETPMPVGSYTVYLAPKLGADTGEAQPVTIDQSVPEKYWNEATSDISIPVAEGPNKVEVLLEK